MCVGAVGFIQESVATLMVTLFFMGMQSAFFGPLKLAIIPEMIKKNELVTGNALIGMGTFVSILLGTILGGVLISIGEVGINITAFSVIIFAIIGTLFSRKVVSYGAMAPELKIDYGIIRPTWKIAKIVTKSKGVFLSVLGVSWFWFLGAALLSMFPIYVKNTLGSNEHVATLFLAIFSVGVATGSIICEKISQGKLELGLVPIGSIGMSLFIFDLFLIGSPVLAAPEHLKTLGEFFNTSYSYRIIFDLFMFSTAAGFFIIPLNTYIQQFSDIKEVSRTVGANNILNAIFMVVASVLLTVFYQIGLSMPTIFLIWAILNCAVSIYIYTIIPEFLLRFVSFVLTRLVYKLKVTGEDLIPETGGLIITSNHVSFVDALVIHGSVRRPVRFVMYYKFMKLPFMKFLFRGAGVIPIAGRSENLQILEAAMAEIENALKRGEVVCIFPEGSITRTGKLDGFRPGIEKILETVPVPVTPITLHGLWGSFFSRKHGGAALSTPSVLFKNWFQTININIYKSWPAEDVSAKKLEDFTRSHLNE